MSLAQGLTSLSGLVIQGAFLKMKPLRKKDSFDFIVKCEVYIITIVAYGGQKLCQSLPISNMHWLNQPLNNFLPWKRRKYFKLSKNLT